VSNKIAAGLQTTSTKIEEANLNW